MTWKEKVLKLYPLGNNPLEQLPEDAVLTHMAPHDLWIDTMASAQGFYIPGDILMCKATGEIVIATHANEIMDHAFVRIGTIETEMGDD